MLLLYVRCHSLYLVESGQVRLQTSECSRHLCLWIEHITARARTHTHTNVHIPAALCTRRTARPIACRHTSYRASERTDRVSCVCVWAHPFGREIAVGLVLHDRARLRICFPAGRILCAMATYETTGVSRTAVDYSRHAVARDLGVCSTRLRGYSLCVASVFSTN